MKHTALSPCTDDSPLLTYDGSPEGFFTVVFQVYARRLDQVTIVPDSERVQELWRVPEPVVSDLTQAHRVMRRLQVILGKDGWRTVQLGFLMDSPEREAVLLDVIRETLRHPHPRVLEQHTHPAIFQLTRWQQKVSRERHRMLAFVRFELMDNGVYFARIAPDCDVLPLIIGHFKRRFADQRWLIFDARREYGVYFEDGSIHWVDEIDPVVLTHPSTAHSPLEITFQRLWRTYFQSVTIPERQNRALQRRCMPRRYWQWLTEMQPEIRHEL